MVEVNAELVVVAATILIAVLTAYGAIIWRNYDASQMLKQRLMGSKHDVTDEGFLHEVEDEMAEFERRFDEAAKERGRIEGKMEANHEMTQRQMFSMNKKLDHVIDQLDDVERPEVEQEVRPPDKWSASDRPSDD